jgi:hypothetical protein
MKDTSLKVLSKNESGGFDIIPEMQGYTFGGDNGNEPMGPFRIEYVLCNDFMINFNDLRPLNPVAGLSNVKLAGQISRKNLVVIPYNNATDRTMHFYANVTLEADAKDGYLQRLVVTNLPKDVNDAIIVANMCVSSILDSISFRKQTPLQIRNVRVCIANSGDELRLYFTIPYFLPVDLEEEADLLTSQNMPNTLRPLLRLFREAINSTSPHYRLLCLYRIKEGLDKVAGNNTQIVKSKGTEPRRQRVLVPDNQTTNAFFPDLIGKGVGEFISYVYTNYRIPIAHFNLDEYEKMLLDPAHSKTDHELDTVNSVLVKVIPEMIKNEWDFMNRHSLM